MSTTPPLQSPYLTDQSTTRDYLHFSDFEPALRSILQGAQTPLTVGVFGPWGSGKTSLMRMLRAEIDAKDTPSLRTVSTLVDVACILPSASGLARMTADTMWDFEWCCPHLPLDSDPLKKGWQSVRGGDSTCSLSL